MFENSIPESFKMTELGPLPEEWDVVRLGDVSIVKTSFPSFNSIQKIDSQNNDDEMVLALKVSDMNNPVNQKYIIESQIAFHHPKNDLKKSRFLQPDSIIFPKRGGAIGTNKKRITKYYSILDPNLIGVEPSKKVDNEYLYCFFEQFDLRSLQDNTPIPQLNKNHVVSILLPFPPFPEQQKIAEVLSTVQQAKEKTDAVISATKELKKSLMRHLFSYGPVPVKKFNEFDEFNELGVNEFGELGVNELQNAQNSSNSINLKETEIGLMPEEWEVVRLGDIASFKNGINFTKDQKGKSGILTIDVLNMYSEGIYVNLNNLYRVNKQINDDYLLQNGDVLFVRSSLKREGVGWTSLFRETQEPVTFCGFVIRARLKSNSISPEFLTNYLRTKNARENLIASSGKVAITNINQGMLGRISVPLPSLPVQQKIATILSAVDRKIETEETTKKALDELFKSILHNLMTGKVRVNHIEVML